MCSETRTDPDLCGCRGNLLPVQALITAHTSNHIVAHLGGEAAGATRQDIAEIVADAPIWIDCGEFRSAGAAGRDVASKVDDSGQGGRSYAGSAKHEPSA